MDTLHLNITDFFEELLSDVKCHQDTRAYIVSIYGKYKSAQFDLSKDSITTLFAQGRDKQDFLTYQNLGDWIFFTQTMVPNHLQWASKDYYDTVARLSYYSCYKLINRQWKLFEELADNFLLLERQVKEKLSDLKMSQTSADIYIVPFGS
jgi:hypothetical protein